MPPLLLSSHHHHHHHSHRDGLKHANEKSRRKRGYSKSNQNFPHHNSSSLQTSNISPAYITPHEYYEDGQTPNQEYQNGHDVIVYDDLLGYDEIASDISTTQSSLDHSQESGVGYSIQPEEVGIVIGILLLWIGAIALFFNRWGKIRMLEPYQPKFCEEHRPSCPISEPSSVPAHFPKSFSKLNFTEENPHPKCRGSITGGGGGLPMNSFGIPTANTSNYAAAATKAYRLRQNSIFTSTPHSGVHAMNHIHRNTSRKTKSAYDLPSLVLSEEFYETLRKNSGKNAISHV